MAFGLNEPAPPDHVPPVAPLPTAPASCTTGLVAHTIWSGPAFTVTGALMKIVMASLAGGHGRPDAALVRTSVTLPAAISAALGVYCALSAVRPGLNVPVPPVHAPVVTVPLTDPASCTVAALPHTTWSGPALTIVIGSMVTCMASATGPHGPAGSFVVSVNVTPPAAISVAVGR